jgi:hypothetical protein
MAESKGRKLPNFDFTEELVEFFETNDLGEYESELFKANFEIDLKRNRYWVSIDKELMDKLLATAREQRVPVETLVGSWLKEKFV